MIEAIAKVCHEANRAWCRANQDFCQEKWEETEAWQRDAAIKGVMFLLQNPGAVAADVHNEWMSKKLTEGWVHGKEKDVAKKIHPCLLPFNDLPLFEQKKDFLFQAIVNALK